MSTGTERIVRAFRRVGRRLPVGLGVLLLLAAVATTLPAGAPAEQASQPTSAAAGQLDSGNYHTCALLASASLRCWGFNGDGQLGYGNRTAIGDDETPGSVAIVNLGADRTGLAIAAGDFHTCALLDNGTVRCWGYGFDGRLGYANTANYGDDETPGSVGTVDIGADRTAKAITAGAAHTCALLDNHTVRCWGYGGNGRLGDGTDNLTDNQPQSNIGDNETPGSVAPVDLGAERTAKAITAGQNHVCARQDDGTVRCWGFGGNGRLGYCNTNNVGDDETPGSVGPVYLETPGPACVSTGGGGTGTAPAIGGAPATGGAQGDSVPVDPPPGAQTAPARGRPGPVLGLSARAASKSKIVLRFRAAGTNGPSSPPARGYLVKQSPRPIRSARDFRRAQSLCKGGCRFPVARVGTKIILRITSLRSRTTYYYAVAARDNVSRELGPRSRTVKAKTR